MNYKDKKLRISDDGMTFRSRQDTQAGTIRKLRKGEEAVVKEEPWFRVSVSGQEGWVRGDFLLEGLPPQEPFHPAPADDLPKFVIGAKNLADSHNTAKIRAVLKDEFGGGRDGDPLQCVEFVQFKINERGIKIKWPVRSGRNGGNWASIFEKAKAYKVLATPGEGYAMSFTRGISTNPKINEIGHVAFVEEVRANGSIKVSEANWPKD